ncbi:MULTISPECIES: folylpolyglutamate synthase/dihydrofolate synthase family protein [unclassified Flavobacterium]|uniref:bifunctional folylpolyglutamate synthase/dihydrofolate synthase n=1 Tax=unclassified Flavobacterium TaxID=196869 RepID=UPI000C18E4A6|nr:MULTISPECIES: folylpolyglutamate synthase/dihydrofolate synthase family protein [unclassified Flavobacterium]PIF60777.1 dihydrofolate synthase/folylpolyglutamate synthase [Flavobacterium sp. 11]WKL45152.1 folylpolyglutamate synthase/dihydrofolate synthase family protein [Flavobacterium sp. ZE23DGlu08]
MNYQETINWMFNQLPMYQLQGASAYKKDLTNTHLLIAHLHHPQEKLKCIHVAGTNGKGSTSHMLASILQEAGYKVGLYTSPHLKDFRERIKINGKDISEEFVTDFINEHKSFFESNDMSFFEMTVGLAFDYFAKEKVDIAVIEVGMGGRLDATNIITPLVSVITNIGLDHTQFLGNTLEAVAFEKAGIIKPNIPVIIGEYTPETKPVFLAKAKECNSEIYFAADLISETYPSDLIGDYQIHNKKTVLQTITVLNSQSEFKITPENTKFGLLNVVKNTGLQGRWQQLNEFPKVICDTAHNKNGLEIVLNQIQKEDFDTLHIVLGVVNDKDLDEILPLFPKKAIYYFCKANIPRGLDVLILKQKAATFELKGEVYNSVSEAYKRAIENAAKSDFIYIGGSTFVVAEIL